MAQTAESQNATLRAADKKANKNTKAPFASNNIAKLQDALWKAGAFKGIKGRNGKELTYEQAVDGLRAKSGKGTTDQALAWAKANGYNVDEKAGTVSKHEQRTPQKQATSNKRRNIFDFISAPGYTPTYVQEHFNAEGQKIVNSNPALALVNRKLHGLLNIPVTYTHAPQEQIYILSDQNQWIYDNWDQIFRINLNNAQRNLANNQKMLSLGKNAKGEPLTESEMENLKQEIANNKKSIASVQSKYDAVKKAGGLEQWLLANPGQKMVMGADFSAYKRANANRMTGVVGKYADFNSTDENGNPNTIAYAMTTPLGKVEYIYGNNMQSFRYDPETKQILTRSSDTYDFNSHGNENDKGIKQLRYRAGNDKDLSDRGKVQYAYDLKPITPGTKGQNYVSSFGKVTRSDTPLETLLLNLGLKYYGAE